jgi:hypothetical protein
LALRSTRLREALFDRSVKLRAHSVQLHVKLIALPQTAPDRARESAWATSI